MINLCGVFPPLTTPFDRGGRLDLKAFRENVRAYSRFQLRGLLVMGSSGEAASLDFEERVRLIEAARNETPRDKVLLVGTGGQSLQETRKLTEIAARNDAEAALVVPPFYYKAAMTPSVLAAYYRELARTADLPILLYSIPQFTGYQFSIPMIAELSRCKNIIGLKESSGNISYFAEITESTAPRFQNLTGSALAFLPSLVLGAKGGILALANVAPQECIDIYEDFKAGRMAEAGRRQRVAMRLARRITTELGIPGLKAAVTISGFHGGYPRSPLRSLPIGIQRQIRTLFQEMKANW